MPLIRFDNLQRRYEGPRGRTVIDGATGVIDAGEFVVVVGRSGSGKSTFLNLLGGLDRPTGGRVWFDGESLFDLPDHDLTRLRRRRMGVIFQSFNLIATLSVEENLRLPLELNGLPVAGQVAAALADVDLSGFEAAMPDQLSGGEQQRVAVARALIHRPEAILADEPTGNLDIDNARRVVGLLDDLCRRDGCTLVMVTHSREVVGRADRLVGIRDGRLVETDEA